MKTRSIYKSADTLLILLVIPIVLVLNIGFLMLTENVLPGISKDKMRIHSERYAEDMEAWSEQIINQLNIYKTLIEKEGGMNEHTIDVLSASYAVYSGYPFGLYWGDENGGFYDVSGWDPGPEYDPTKRIWFSEGLEHTESFAFGDPYIDMRTGKAAVSASMKLKNETPVTVIVADVYFDYLTALVEDASRSEVDHAFLVTEKDGLLIADSDWNMTGKTLDSDGADELYRSVGELIGKGFEGMTTIGGSGDIYVNICRVKGLNSFFVTCTERSRVLGSVYRVRRNILFIGVAADIILIILTWRVSHKMSRAAQRANTDPLTRLMNRDGFCGAVKDMLKRSPDQGIMLLFDVDNFKRVNDELGHPAGDVFLKDLAKLISEYFNRNTDLCSRLGGDEFAVFAARNLTRDELTGMLDRFMELFHSTFGEKYKKQKLSVSIGAAFSGEDGGSSFDAVYKSADSALYQAKNAGKDRYAVKGNKFEK